LWATKGRTEPDGDDVQGGVDSEAETEMGVDGCSGADAVAHLVGAHLQSQHTHYLQVP
jgi:hypothetical protein